MTIYEKLLHCTDIVKEKIGDFKPEIGLVLGTGLNGFGNNKVRVEMTIPYGDIDGFPVSTVVGHAGQFIFGYVEDVPVVVMQGRVHFYEGYDWGDVLLPTRLMCLLGIKALFLSNGSGGLNPAYKAGELMLLKDHISVFIRSPLIGPNIEELGTRFPDMTEVYDSDLRDIIKQTAKDLDITLHEGVYTQLTGPQFETPAEITMLRTLGTDAVGMSTVCEALSANHMGMKVCAISWMANMAAGMEDGPIEHNMNIHLDTSHFENLVSASIVNIAKALR